MQRTSKKTIDTNTYPERFGCDAKNLEFFELFSYQTERNSIKWNDQWKEVDVEICIKWRLDFIFPMGFCLK